MFLNVEGHDKHTCPNVISGKGFNKGNQGKPIFPNLIFKLTIQPQLVLIFKMSCQFEINFFFILGKYDNKPRYGYDRGYDRDYCYDSYHQYSMETKNKTENSLICLDDQTLDFGLTIHNFTMKDVQDDNFDP